MLMARKVAPRGFPTFRSVWSDVSLFRVVLSRKSWVMAIPIEANAKDVRSHARNVLSEVGCQSSTTGQSRSIKSLGILTECEVVSSNTPFVLQLHALELLDGSQPPLLLVLSRPSRIRPGSVVPLRQLLFTPGPSSAAGRLPRP
jgi:hypothetical protein